MKIAIWLVLTVVVVVWRACNREKPSVRGFFGVAVGTALFLTFVYIAAGVVGWAWS